MEDNEPAGFILTIALGNEAMRSPADLAAALRALADDMDNHTAGDPLEPITMGPTTRIVGNVSDANGNHVGSWKVTR